MTAIGDLVKIMPERGMSFLLANSPIEDGLVTIFLIRESATVAEKLRNGVFIETRQAVLPVDNFWLTAVMANLNGFLYESWFYPPTSESTRQCLQALCSQQYLTFFIYETGNYEEPAKMTAILNPDGAKAVFYRALQVSKKLTSLGVDWGRERDQVFSRLPSMDDLWRFLGLSINEM